MRNLRVKDLNREKEVNPTADVTKPRKSKAENTSEEQDLGILKEGTLILRAGMASSFGAKSGGRGRRRIKENALERGGGSGREDCQINFISHPDSDPSRTIRFD